MLNMVLLPMMLTVARTASPGGFFLSRLVLSLPHQMNQSQLDVSGFLLPNFIQKLA